MKNLVIGATGFVGKELVKQLAEKYPGEVRATVRKGSPAKRAALEKIKGLELVEADVTDPESLSRAMAGVDTVYYSVAVIHTTKNIDNLYWKVHVKGTRSAVDVAESVGVKRFILVSGLGTVRSKPGSYMQTRWEMEETVRKSNLGWTVLQPSVIFGEGSEYFEAQAKIIATLPVAALVGGANLRIQPVFVSDVARACIEAAENDDKIGKTIELGGSEVYTNEQLIDLIQKTIKTNRFKIPLPIWAASLNAELLSAVLPNPPLTPATVEMLSFDNVCKEKNVIEKEFGWQPTLLKPYLAEHGIKYQ